LCAVAVISEEPAGYIIYPENGSSRCLIVILFLGWDETELLGTASVNEPTVLASDD
jgi:hypothetical protein